MSNSTRLLKSAIVFAVVIAASIPLCQLGFFAVTAFNPGTHDDKLIQVKKGQSPNEITKNLSAEGIISSAKSFIWVGRLSRQWPRIKAGEYRVSPSMTPFEIFSILTSGISAAHPLTIREGENMYEVADDLQSKELTTRQRFLNLCRDPELMIAAGFLQKDDLPNSVEGYLFPDTYFFDRTQSDVDMLKQMVRRFFALWTAKEEARAKELKMTRHEVITLASIIEKETGAPEERALISSVFHNRLKKKMKLQSDPTTIYGMWERYRGKIHKSDLSAKNEYNTYSVRALPLGPIGNPGKEAIQAALFPKTSPYFYFVSHNDGTHEFSSTFQEHNNAVKKFQLDPKAREGKSWRDLKKAGAAHP